MEVEERPTKLRKLDANGSGPAAEAGAPLLSSVNGRANDSLHDSLQTSKPQEGAANIPVLPDQQSESSEGESDVHPKIKRDPDPAQHERLLLQQQQDGEPTKPLSKNQLKKLRKREEWEAGRDYRKARRKQKTQEKKARKRAAREEEEWQLQLLQPPSDTGQNGEVSTRANPPQPASSKPRSRRHVQLPITIIIDCGFDTLMMEKERISLGSQITRSYSDNHRASYQAHLVITSWGGLLKERFDTVLKKTYLNWKGVRFEEGDFVEAAREMDKVMRDPKEGGRHEDAASSNDAGAGEPPASDETSSLANGHAESESASASASQHPESAQQHLAPSLSDPDRMPTTSTHPSSSAHPLGETIYLTSDSPYTLCTLSPYSTYIIGGLVDKNRHKGICYKTASQKGIKTAKLPIGEYLDMTSRKVLATNHVVEILLRYLEEAEGGREEGAWGRAFLRVIPKRKGGVLRTQGQGDDDGEGEEIDSKAEDDDVDDERQEEEEAGGVTIEQHEPKQDLSRA